ncbi:MAG: hypothetical protein ACK5XN_35430, partial [Bacteroidota bacterium]
ALLLTFTHLLVREPLLEFCYQRVLIVQQIIGLLATYQLEEYLLKQRGHYVLIATELIAVVINQDYDPTTTANFSFQIVVSREMVAQHKPYCNRQLSIRLGSQTFL